jgi:uncharacterized protein YlaI
MSKNSLERFALAATINGSRMPASVLSQRSIRESLCPNVNHHRVAAKGVSKIKRGRPVTSVHGFVLIFCRARARARAQSTVRLYHSILDKALFGQEFGNG